MIEEVKVKGWREAREIVEREAGERLGGKIRNLWVDTIYLTPHWEGSKWVVRLRVVLEKGFMRKEGYLVSAQIDPFTGEVMDFKAEPAR